MESTQKERSSGSCLNDGKKNYNTGCHKHLWMYTKGSLEKDIW